MDKIEGKRLLILGGSRISCEIVRHARAMGVTTGVTDWYELEKSPAKQLADEAYYTSTADIDAMVSLIRDRHFDGVITGFTDSVLPYYAEICGRAGLPAYGTKDQFDIFVDKEKYKDLMRRFGVPTIPEYAIDFEALAEGRQDIPFPVIVKPADSSGSRGITVCRDVGELGRALDFARKSSNAKEVLVEKYIDADEATVLWLFVDGAYYLMMIGNRHVKHNQEGELPLPAGYTYPAAVTPRFLAETAPRMEAMFRSVGIRDGMMFMQCKVVDGECLVYDIGYRLTGTIEYINLKAVCGYDPLDMMIHFALTGSMGEPEIASKADPFLGGRYAYNVSLLCRPGKIAKITGLEEIRRLPGVIDVVVAHPEGDAITEAMKGRLAQITVRVLGRADTIGDMRREMLQIQRLGHVVSTEGQEMVLPGLEEGDFGDNILQRP